MTDFITSILTTVSTFLPMLITLVLLIPGLTLTNSLLKRRWRDNPDAQFRFQLIMLSLSFAAGLILIITLPITDVLRGQLLSLIGILLSAAIALSATTFIGNILAGIMLKVIKNIRPGEFITIEDITGRVTEMGLLHTEVQTEDRDLVTVPNLYVVTKPMKVVRSSGTIVSAEISLGYDVSHTQISGLLCEAAESSGLKETFVQVRELGDFAVVYRVAGLLEEVNSILSARSKLREAMLDTLHNANIEIVSPTFMNTRTLKNNTVFIPTAFKSNKQVPEAASPEEVAFDKADEAESIEKIRQAIENIDVKISILTKEETLETDKQQLVLNIKKESLVKELKAAEQQLKASDREEHTESDK